MSSSPKDGNGEAKNQMLLRGSYEEILMVKHKILVVGTV